MHWFPMAAGIGGDALDLHVARFDELIESLYDLESWKAGESDEKRRERKLLDYLEQLL